MAKADGEDNTFINMYDKVAATLDQAEAVLSLALNALLFVAEKEGEAFDWHVIHSLEAVEGMVSEVHAKLKEFDRNRPASKRLHLVP